MSLLPSPQPPDQYSNIEDVREVLHADGRTLLGLFSSGNAGGIGTEDVQVLIDKLLIFQTFLQSSSQSNRVMNDVDELLIDCAAAQSLYQDGTGLTRKEFLKLIREIAGSLTKL